MKTGLRRVIPVLAMALVACTEASFAGDVLWGHTGTDWGQAANWVGGSGPATADRAFFPDPDAAPVIDPITVQPSITGDVSVAGLYLWNGDNNAAQTWHVQGNGILRLGELGLYISDDRNTSEIYPDIVVDADQVWRHDRNYTIPLFGGLSGTGTISLVEGTLLWRQTNGPTMSGDLVISGGNAYWDLENITQAGNYAFGSIGTIVLGNDNCEFLFEAEASHGVPPAPNGVEVTFTSPVRVERVIGQLWARQLPGTAPYPHINMTGPISLGGVLEVGHGNSHSYGSNADYDGTVTLDQSAYSRLGWLHGADGHHDPDSIDCDGDIVDGPGTARNPLIMQSAGRLLNINSAGNTYAGGTIVDFTASMRHGGPADGEVAVGSGGVLGTGDLKILPGGRISLADSGGLAAGAELTMESSDTALAVLGLGYNGLPDVDANAAGVIAIQTAGYDTITDQSAVGNGRMFLGSITGGDISAASLAPCSDNIYRLGGGAPGEFNLDADDLGIDNSVLTGTAGLQVGEFAWHGNGNVRLESANDFTGDIEVRGIPRMSNGGPYTSGSGLEGRLRDNGSPLGAREGDLTLYGSSLRIYGQAGGLPAEKRAVDYHGYCRLLVEGNSQQTDLLVDSLAATGDGVLVISDVDHTLGGLERCIVTNALNQPALTSGIVLPNVIKDDGFAAYDVVNGFTDFAAYLADINAATAADVVGVAAATLTADRSMYALRNTGTVGPGGSTANLGAGGVFMAGQIDCDLNFGVNKGMLYVSGSQTLNGNVHGSGGVVKTGSGILTMNGTGHDFTGDMVLNGGMTACNFDSGTGTGSFGDAGNDIYVNGSLLQRGQYNSGDRILASRTVHLGPEGGAIWVRYSSCYIYAEITGPGMFFCDPMTGSTVVMEAVNSYTGGTWCGAGILATAAGTLGTGDVTVDFRGTLTLQGDANISTGARLNTVAGGTTIFACTAPQIGSLSGTGDVRLGAGGSDTVLTLGLDDSDSLFYGRLFEDAGRTCGVTKEGAGTWTLRGCQDYTGATTVNDGTLDMDAHLSGDLGIAGGGELRGRGEVGGSFDLDGMWVVQLNSDTDYDNLVVGGDMTGSGALQVVLGPGYDPPKGTVWTIVDGAGSVPPFENVTPNAFVAMVSGNDLLLSNPARGTMILVR